LITPLVEEEEWLTALRDLPPFEPGSEPIVVISPHPDDESLGAGGLIAFQRKRGVPICIIAVTDGENAYGFNNPQLRKTRQREQSRAVRELGLGESQLVRLGFTDSSLMPAAEDIAGHIAPYVTNRHHILAPWTGDFHPDHEACGRAAEKLARRIGARLTWYFFWTWHRGDPSLLKNVTMAAFPLSRDLREAKWRAIQAHRSQLEHPGGQPILPENLLAPARRNFEVFAPA
jgi:LmbE family N-acetylglucosaminyl deacetylase